MSWIRGAIGAVCRFFGFMNEEKPSIQDSIPPPPSDPPIMPPAVKPPSITVYTLAEVAGLEKMNFLTYFYLITPLAKLIEAETGIFWMAPLVQSAHESAHGNSGLARKALNLFGIKATDSWRTKNGRMMVMDAVEDAGMVKPKVPVEWRCYESWLESFRDWAALMQKPVYAPALPLLKDQSRIEEAFVVLGRIYAADIHYAEQLITLYRSIKSA